MLNRKLIISNTSGLHLRPAGILCKTSMEFESKISFTVRGNKANAKSVLSVLGACVKSGDELEFTFEGEDEEEAMTAIVKLIGEGLED